LNPPFAFSNYILRADLPAVSGIGIIVILFVPLVFQVVIPRHEQEWRRLQVQERLARIEEKIDL